MKCVVCPASFSSGHVCPQCGYDHEAPDFNSADKILKAREEFKQRVTAYNPESRVNWRDRLVPWGALVLGFVLFMFYLRACSTMGWRIF